MVWGNTIRGETPYGGAVAKTIPNLALKPTVMVGKIDVIMAAISLRCCSCLCVYEVRNSKFRMSTAIFSGSNIVCHDPEYGVIILIYDSIVNITILRHTRVI